MAGQDYSTNCHVMANWKSYSINNTLLLVIVTEHIETNQAI